MEKEFTEQSMAKLAVVHCKIGASQLVSLATESVNPALRDQVQKAIQANLEQQKSLWDASFHAGYFPYFGTNPRALNKDDAIAPSLSQSHKGGI
jgi:spore coat protein CotF